MTILYWILLVIHIAVSVGLVLVILAQSSKGGALDGMLGGVATSTFGSGCRRLP
jgi:protein translocase SecG subunit